MASNKVKQIRQLRYEVNQDMDETERQNPGFKKDTLDAYYRLVDSGLIKGRKDKRIRRNKFRHAQVC